MTAIDFTTADHVDPPRVLLPPYKLWLTSVRDGPTDAPTWRGSEWREDRSELLGGERSVFYWLHALLGRPRAQSLEWTRLYLRVRDASGWPVTRETVPARLLHDVVSHEQLFDRLARASWCTACHAAPALTSDGFCAWCGAAPIGVDCGPCGWGVA